MEPVSLLEGEQKQARKKLSQIARIVGGFGAMNMLTGRNNDFSYIARADESSADFDLLPRVTKKVYVDVRIANYTEESIGTNRGGAGSGR